VLLDGLLLSVFFRSLRTGVIGMLPAAMTVALAFGAIGVAALPLGIANAMFASIVIGVGMDFPVHVLATYERACAGGLRCGAALHGTLEEAGLSVTTSAIALALAFLVLLASSTAPTMQLGLVVAFGLATTGVLTLVLLPAALVLWNGRSKPEEDLKTAAT
jgi:predicted RND superfamily exporter protein